MDTSSHPGLTIKIAVFGTEFSATRKLAKSLNSISIIRGANFSGLIPHQLWNLSSLRYLSLGDNSDLYVDNLRWMSGLSTIQYLGLSSADLHREVDWLQIMSKFPSLMELYFTSLLRLDLTNSSLKGNIPPSIFDLEKLESLSLYTNKLVEQIPEPLSQFKHLTYLDLGVNSLNGPIPSSFGNLSRIRTLLLDKNRLNGTIPKSHGLLSKLEALYVGKNSLMGIVDEGHFRKLSKLKVLYMTEARLFFNVNSNWVPPFPLDHFSMSSMKIGPNFPSWLQSQRSLIFLDMSMFGISGKTPSWF
uniref:Uncharacterized protein n=1 Tax=Quercus lobata TaxID=97700 RepID=A0A7N2LJZ2_QUELO